MGKKIVLICFISCTSFIKCTYRKYHQIDGNKYYSDVNSEYENFGIENIDDDESGNLVVTYKNGTRKKHPLQEAISSIAKKEYDPISGNMTINRKDGSQQIIRLRGETGVAGIDGQKGNRGLEGLKGINGNNGTNGRGIQDITFTTTSNTLKIIYSDGSFIEIPNLKGPKGDPGNNGISINTISYDTTTDLCVIRLDSGATFPFKGGLPGETNLKEASLKEITEALKKLSTSTTLSTTQKIIIDHLIGSI